MANKNPGHPKEFTIPNGDAPSSTIIVVDFHQLASLIQPSLVLSPFN
jgi:hypothetical protein